LIFYRALAQSGIGIALMLLTLVLIAAIIIIYIMMAIKLLIIYLKMLAMIIYAPIVFAVSAIPGSEDHMVNWFKKLLAYTLSLPAVTGAAALTSLLGISVLLGNSNSPNALVWYGGVLVTMFVSPIIIIGGFFIALKLPDQIEAAIVGDTGGGKKRR
ncbi:MAG TPA: hypothetical protein VLI92_02015, partial [Candidatus Saccharimonadales bacterium]|nr:hypothetical protein [Candidatus Saccharimonadales bacterium]